MRLLLDEHLNWRLAREFSDAHEVRSVRSMGWAGKKNGVLLGAAESEFDVFVTMDGNMEYQQSSPKYGLAVVLLVERSNRLEDTVGLVPEIERLLAEDVEPGRLYRVGH